MTPSLTATAALDILAQVADQAPMTGPQRRLVNDALAVLSLTIAPPAPPAPPPDTPAPAPDAK